MNKKGFTLIEILVVVAIIGLLSTITTAIMKSARLKSEVAKAQHEIDQINTAMGLLDSDCGVWPGGQVKNQVGVAGNELCGDGCANSLFSAAGGLSVALPTCANWSGPYIKSITQDAWGSQYFFDTSYQINTVTNEPCPGPLTPSCQNAVVIGSYGPDKVGNNQFTSDDVIKVIFK